MHHHLYHHCPPPSAPSLPHRSLLAIKQIRGTQLEPREVKKLVAEYELFSTFDHPNLVKQYALEWRSGGLCNIYMEYIPGGTVGSVISRFKTLHVQIIRNYTQQLLEGLRFLHDRSVGIVHRDVKPSNLLADVDGTIKLADFGLARLLEGADRHHTLMFQGSPPYMSPEACQGEISFALDIWAVGCTVIEMATGAPPWPDLHHLEPLAFVWKIARDQQAPPCDGTNLDPKGLEFLSQCFTIDPVLRPSCDTLMNHPFIAAEDMARSLLLPYWPHPLLSKDVDSAMVRGTLLPCSLCGPHGGSPFSSASLFWATLLRPRPFMAASCRKWHGERCLDLWLCGVRGRRSTTASHRQRPNPAGLLPVGYRQQPFATPYPLPPRARGLV